MRISRFNDNRIGLVEGDTVRDVTDWARGIIAGIDPEAPGDALVRALPALAAATPPTGGASFALDAVRLLSPVRNPTKIIAAPDNYRAHMAEMLADPTAGHGRAIGDLEKAGLFLKATSSLVGPTEGIRQRFLERRTDYEIELVAVIGQTAADISEDAALGCLAGYAVGLDITVRGPEERSLRKSIDTYTVLGPYLVTADEIGAPDDIDLLLTLDGAVKQSTNTDDMVSSVARLIAYASRFYTLEPGDLLYTGTCSGVGPIRPGNVLVASASRIGTMRVAVSAAS